MKTKTKRPAVKTRSVRLSEQTWGQLELAAKLLGLSNRTEVIRFLATYFVDNFATAAGRK